MLCLRFATVVAVGGGHIELDEEMSRACFFLVVRLKMCPPPGEKRELNALGRKTSIDCFTTP